MLQIFTYSTGLALTGRSAACVPETATSPAAEPRRRLFTIFIRTSKLLFMGGFRLRRVHCRPMDGRSPSVPSSVQTPDQKTPSRPGTQTWRPRDAPSVATVTLLDDSLLATVNHASYQQPTQFSAVCCLKNTHFPAAECPSGQLLEGYASVLRVQNSRGNQSVLPVIIFYALFTKLDHNFT